MIYPASPYSHPEASVRQERFERICRIAGELMRDGHVVFSPIAYTHPIACACDLPRGWEYWEKFDQEFIARASKLLVAKMDGWEESRGVQAEILLAKAYGVPVEYMDVELVVKEWKSR